MPNIITKNANIITKNANIITKNAKHHHQKCQLHLTPPDSPLQGLGDNQHKSV
jgi:hypothetical protein